MGRIQRFRGKLLECRLKLFKINKYEFYSSSFTNHWSILFGYVLATQIKEVKPTLKVAIRWLRLQVTLLWPNQHQLQRGNGTASTCQMKATSNSECWLGSSAHPRWHSVRNWDTFIQQSYYLGRVKPLHLSSSWKPRILYFRCIRLQLLYCCWQQVKGY